MNVSVIIPTYNSGLTLERCLTSIKKMKFKGKYEMIVVDGCSKDSTVEIAKRFGARIFYEDIGNRAGACNIGIKKARYGFVAFTDDDCVVDENWLTELTSSMFEGVTSVGGPNITPRDDTEVATHLGKVLEFFSMFGPRYAYTSKKRMETFHNPGCNVLYRKSAIVEVGYFDEKLVTCEDEELDYRLKKKGKILYNPKAIVLHYRRSTLHKVWKQSSRYAIGRIQASKKHFHMLKWFHLIPPLSIISILILFLLGISNPLILQIAIFLTCGVIISFFVTSLYIKMKSGGSTLMYFLIMVIWLIAWSFGFFKGFWK